ncbi:hypothetical protein U1Q18_014505 [Sarracenia purpurea var. burkii]
MTRSTTEQRAPRWTQADPELGSDGLVDQRPRGQTSGLDDPKQQLEDQGSPASGTSGDEDPKQNQSPRQC